MTIAERGTEHVWLDIRKEDGEAGEGEMLTIPPFEGANCRTQNRLEWCGSYARDSCVHHVRCWKRTYISRSQCDVFSAQLRPSGPPVATPL